MSSTSSSIRFLKKATATVVTRRKCVTAARSPTSVTSTTAARRWKSATTTTAAATAIPKPTTVAAGATKTTTSTSTTTSSSVPIVPSLLAALAGVTTVSIAAAIVEQVTADSCPTYDIPTNPSAQRFDQSTFSGRFAKMLLACDPRLLFYTNTQVLQAQELLVKHSQGAADISVVDDRTLWEARRLVDAAIHPDNGEFLPRPFRMSGYVPFNGPICVAMVASTTTPSLLFWSWVNQSQNALVNYYNRSNASEAMPMDTLVISYTAAVTSALTVAFGLATIIQKRFPKDQAKQLMKWVAFPSAITASSLNCYIVRSPEIQTGIPLLDEDGNEIKNPENGDESMVSYEAAKRGVYTTTLSRAILQAPVYFLPPVLMASIRPLSNFVAKNPNAYTVPVTTFLLLTSFGIGLPAAIAIFPQRATISAQDTEPYYQHLMNPTTKRPYEMYYYNKGL